MKGILKFFDKGMALTIPWSVYENESSAFPSTVVLCTPYHILFLPKKKLLVMIEEDDRLIFKEHEAYPVHVKCPLGTQKLLVSDEYDFYHCKDFDPIELDVSGWMEHCMCGSILCPAARQLMSSRRAFKTKEDKVEFQMEEAFPETMRCKGNAEPVCVDGYSQESLRQLGSRSEECGHNQIHKEMTTQSFTSRVADILPETDFIDYPINGVIHELAKSGIILNPGIKRSWIKRFISRLFS